MIIKGLTFCDLINYKKPAMVVAFPSCSFKCDIECGQKVCQNSALAGDPPIPILVQDIVIIIMNQLKMIVLLFYLIIIIISLRKILIILKMI